MDDCALCRSLRTEPAIFEDDLWHLRPIEAPTGVAGWLILVAKRHVAGPGHFDDREAESYGPTLRHFCRLLEQSSGALRVYTAALGEAVPHFHCHLVPRYADAPKKGWGLFDLQRAAKEGELRVDPKDVERALTAMRDAVTREPLRR